MALELDREAARQVARACLAAAEAMTAIAVALVGEDVVDEVEAEDFPEELDPLYPGCDDPNCAEVHDHGRPPNRRTVEDG